LVTGQAKVPQAVASPPTVPFPYFGRSQRPKQPVAMPEGHPPPQALRQGDPFLLPAFQRIPFRCF